MTEPADWSRPAPTLAHMLLEFGDTRELRGEPQCDGLVTRRGKAERIRDEDDIQAVGLFPEFVTPIRDPSPIRLNVSWSGGPARPPSATFHDTR